VRIAKELYVRLAVTSNVEYDDGWAIGKRYRRQDEIGTPWCITVDHTSVEDGTVTLRHRDTMEQTRVTLAEIK
jgi:glycyl-tRNA synthetase